ncbi:MFS transporter [Chloroflexota bacterium]
MPGTALAARFARSFHHRDFRFLWLSNAFVGLGEQMELVLVGWFVLSETDSPLLVSLYGALRFTGTLFAPFFGALADRYSRKMLLILVRASFLSVAVAILLLSVMGRLEVWSVLALAGVAGVGRGFDNVVREAVLADLVPGDLLMNAVAVTRTARDVTQMAGPLSAGFILGSAGMTYSYGVVAGVYVAAIGAGLALSVFKTTTKTRAVSIWHDLTLAVVYVRRHEVLLGLLLTAFLVNLTAFPLNNGLMPLFARDVLAMGPVGLGGLLSAYAAGALLGSLVIAVMPIIGRPGRTVVLASLGWHTCLLLFSLSGRVVPSFGLLVGTGMAQSFTMVVMGMLLLQTTGYRFRGRVMGLRSLAIYGLPVGLLATGALTERLGAPAALMTAATTGIVLTLLIAMRLKGMWRVAER